MDLLGYHYEDKQYKEGIVSRKQLRDEKLYIYYDKNFMGWNGPRKMRIFQPKFNPKRAGFLKIKPTIREESIELLSSKFNKIVSKDSKIMKQIGNPFIKINQCSQKNQSQDYSELVF
jgi:hypothetical protein